MAIVGSEADRGKSARRPGRELSCSHASQPGLREGRLVAQSTASRSRSSSSHRSAIAAVVAKLQGAGHPQASSSGVASVASPLAARGSSCIHAAPAVLRDRVVAAQATADKGRVSARGAPLGTSIDVSNRDAQSETGAVAQSTARQGASSAAGPSSATWLSREAGGWVPVPWHTTHIHSPRRTTAPERSLGRELESSHAGRKGGRPGAQGTVVMPAERSAAEHRLLMESRAGDATRAELELELLQDKRRRLVQLSRDVLEVRCPGFCQLTGMCEEDYLREAGYALASISADVGTAAQALRTATAWCADVAA